MSAIIKELILTLWLVQADNADYHDQHDACKEEEASPFASFNPSIKETSPVKGKRRSKKFNIKRLAKSSKLSKKRMLKKRTLSVSSKHSAQDDDQDDENTLD